jgi:hypothetical protein
VTAGADFVIERAVYFVGFGTEDGGKVIRHASVLDVVCALRREVNSDGV